MTGRLVKSAMPIQNGKLDVSNLTDGMYVISILAEGSSGQYCFIKRSE
jgi:hypothetical protein